MGSMLEVMKKLRQQQNGAEAAAAAVAPEPGPSRFDAAASTIADPQSPGTVSWDAQRVDPAVVAFHDRYHAVCEQYRAVRARLATNSPTTQHRVITLTSSIPQEGKSVSTVNLGLLMAEGGEHQVVIADADFRRKSVGKMLGLPGTPGLAEFFSGEATLDEVLRPTPFPNLKVIVAGATRNHAYGELLGHSGARDGIMRLRERFDYTLIDTPPVTTVSDVGMLAPHCDGVLLVVEMHRTPEPTVQKAVRSLQSTHRPILGCILSRYSDRRENYYGRYYDYYYKK